MLLEYFLAIIAGILLGTITGLLPGIHSNLVAGIVLALSPVLLQYFSPVVLAVCIVAMFTTHVFVDFVPSIFLGAPDSDTVLSILPGHQFLLRGAGYDAVRLSVIGCFFGVVACIVLLPVLLYLVPLIYAGTRKYIGIILIAVSAFMILRETDANRKFYAFFSFLLSGIFGLAVFSLNMDEPLLPMLSGLFGISLLVVSIFQRVRLPAQDTSHCTRIDAKELVKTISIGALSGTLVSIYPAIGPSQAAIIGMQMMKNIRQHLYLVLIGAVNSVSVMLSLVTLYTINKARNGPIAIMSEFIPVDLSTLLILAGVVLCSGTAAFFLSLGASRIFLKIINIINYQKLCIFVIIFISLLVLILSGPLGLFILAIGTAIGIMPSLTGAAKTNLMGCLLIPVILYFF